MTPCDCLEVRHTMFTWRLHHAGPELRYYVQRVAFRAAQFVDVNAGRRAHVAVVADEKVKVLQQERGETHHHFIQIYNIRSKLMLGLNKVYNQQQCYNNTTSSFPATVGMKQCCKISL